MTYDEFLNSKVCVAEDSGFDVDNNEINPNLKPHQREAVKWACKGGRRALFESFGLGKTVQELEYCRLVLKHEGGRALLVLPLGVRQEFTHDAVNLLEIKPPKYVRTMKEIESCTDEIWDDINRMKTLNTLQSRRKKNLHICPLQLDIVERIINRYSNPGETVLDPFGGLMTVPYMAVKLGRKGYGIELNLDSFRDGVGYLKQAEEQKTAPTLFDFVQKEESEQSA